MLVLHILACVGLLLTGLPPGAVASGLVLVVASLWWELGHRMGLPASGGIRAALLDADGDWHLVTEKGVVAASLLPSSRIWPRLLILRFRAAGSRQWLVLPNDAIAADDFRRLQVRLRHGP